MSKKFQDVPLRRYADLALSLSNKVLSVSIRDQSGVTVWHQARGDRPATELAGVFPPDSAAWKVLDHNVYLHRFGADEAIFASKLKCSDPALKVYLCLEYELSDEKDLAFWQLAGGRATACLRDLIANHAGLRSELNSMTDELLRRYEELNLVYNTEDDIRHLSEASAALRQIVDNCVEYLDIEMCVLFQIESESEIKRLHENVLSNGDLRVLDTAQKTLAKWMLASNEIVILNTREERAACGFGGDFSHKVAASPVRGTNGRVCAVLAVLRSGGRGDFENSDRNLLRVMTEKAAKILGSEYDSLTGLMNRESFQCSVSRVVMPGRPKRGSASLLHANIDRLQLVNDTLGHEVGDKLIFDVAEVLHSQLRGHDRIGRIGGDDFGIILDECDEKQAMRLAERLCNKVVALQCGSADRRLDVGISIGVVPIKSTDDDVISIMAAADLACSVAKDHGRGRAYLFSGDDDTVQVRTTQMHWVGKIQSALKEDRFVLFSQLIAPVDPGSRLPHYEVLLRMLADDGSILSPFVFLPVAERYHMMPEVDRWVVEHSLRTLEEFQLKAGELNGIFTINLSGLTLTDQRSLSFMLDRLRASRLDCGKICFEITETAVITNLAAAQHFIASVKDFGCKFALDDFGSGVSSFSNLRGLDVDYLKIDGSFVVNMEEDPVAAAMVAAINQVGQTMKLETIAEFVESEKLITLLTALGVDYLQGYGIGKPRPLSEQLEELLLQEARSA